MESKLFIISVVIHEKSGYFLCQAHIINAVEFNNYWHKFSPLINDKYALCIDLIKYQSLYRIFCWGGGGGGGGGILVLDSIMRQDIGICIVFFGLLVVFVFLYCTYTY